MKKPNPPKLVTLALTTTITIVFWIFFTLYRVLASTPKSEVDEKLLEPIIPELDNASLETLNKKVFFEEGSYTFNQNPNFQNQSTTPTATPTPQIQEEVTPAPEEPTPTDGA